MRIIAALFLMAAAFYVLAEAKRDDLEPARQVPGRRFKVRPLRRDGHYFRHGLVVDKNEVPLRGNAYNSIAKAFANVTPPASFNWLEKPYVVTPVKYQGNCGSCYAFSAAAALESMMSVWHGISYLDFSEQQIVDCVRENGCSGNSMTNVYRYVAANKGLKLELSYPYTGKVGPCKNTSETMRANSITDAGLPYGDENTLKKILYTMGPISIGLHGDQDTFYKYAEGIYDDPACTANPKGVDHAVLLVGYGEEKGTPYWIIKNSWGTWWGEKGYMRILRGEGMCRIGHMQSIPLPTWLSTRLEAGEDVRHRFRVD